MDTEVVTSRPWLRAIEPAASADPSMRNKRELRAAVEQLCNSDEDLSAYSLCTFNKDRVATRVLQVDPTGMFVNFTNSIIAAINQHACALIARCRH